MSKATWRWAGYLLLIIGLILLYLLHPGSQAWLDRAWTALSSGEVEAMRRWVEAQGRWAKLVLVLAFVGQMFLVVVPTWGLMLVCVVLYGPWVGGLLSLVGMICASLVGYGVGHELSGPRLDSWLGTTTRTRIAHYVAQYGAWTVVLFRLLPFLSNDAISFVAGFFRMGLLRFLLASLVGITPLIALLGWLGQYDGRLLNWLYLLSGLALLLWLGYWAWQRWASHSDKT